MSLLPLSPVKFSLMLLSKIDSRLITALVLLFAGSLAAAAPSVSDNTISWPDDGWYQVQQVNDDGITEVCASGRSCEVSQGEYIVINHTTSERFTCIVITGTSTTDSVTVTNNTISWPSTGWYQVLNSDTYTEICNGTRSCDVAPGSYIVINHSTGERFENIVVGETTTEESSITVMANTISWANDGWYQVQTTDTFESICNGETSCVVPNGEYVVINHDTGMRWDNVIVGETSTAVTRVNGGASASCSAARLEVTDGSCGLSADVASTTPPVTSLCQTGLASIVGTDGDNWSWACDGVNGGASASCSAANSNNFLYHILSTGQSLALGQQPVYSVTQPYTNNYMLSPFNSQIGIQGTLRPLIQLSEIPKGLESPSSGILNSLTGYGSGKSFALSNHARGGTPYAGIRKNGSNSSYGIGMLQAQNTKLEAESISLVYKPLAVTLIHGEADQRLGNANVYDTFINELQRDYQYDLNSLTNESSKTIPLFFSQMNSISPDQMAVAQLRAHNSYPNSYLVTPLYQYTYTDQLHLDSFSSRHLGEQFAKVIENVVFRNNEWNPLMPTSYKLNNIELVVTFHTPRPPIVIDTTSVADRTDPAIRMMYGFQFFDDSELIGISSVSVYTDDQLLITLESEPTGAVQRLTYSARSDLGQVASGGADVPNLHGGNIRDSDNSISPALNSTGKPLYNWLVSFDDIVPSQ